MIDPHRARTYPSGVPCWIDTEQPDPEAAQDFYKRLFGWTFATISYEGGPSYTFAHLDGREVAGLASTSADRAAWNTYIAVDDPDAALARLSGLGGEIVAGPVSAGEGGRMAVCLDPAGAAFRLWHAERHLGAQVVNAPGSWNFSDLHTDRPEDVAFYTELFGWSVEDLGFATMIRRPGYGDHLEATVDPDIRARQRGVSAPPGFEDTIAWVAPLEPGGSPYWHVTFAVADRDDTAATAERLGADVLATEDTQWTRTVLIRDPQGAGFTASEFTPPG